MSVDSWLIRSEGTSERNIEEKRNIEETKNHVTFESMKIGKEQNDTRRITRENYSRCLVPIPLPVRISRAEGALVESTNIVRSQQPIVEPDGLIITMEGQKNA